MTDMKLLYYRNLMYLQFYHNVMYLQRTMLSDAGWLLLDKIRWSKTSKEENQEEKLLNRGVFECNPKIIFKDFCQFLRSVGKKSWRILSDVGWLSLLDKMRWSNIGFSPYDISYVCQMVHFGGQIVHLGERKLSQIFASGETNFSA